jgi:hypothetical protein
MAVQVFLFFLVLCLALFWRLGRLHRQPSHSKTGAVRPTVQRLLKPRSPLDCPSCQLSCAPSPAVRPAAALVRPWGEVKSWRGAPKRIDTAGFACPNPQCAYLGITDAHIHALVGDGKHGHAERIQTFRCQACHTTFSARLNTPLYRLKTPAHQVAMVLAALAEGLDPSAAERVFGFRQGTITTWLSRAGKHAQILHERSFCHLQLPHLQLDELRTRLRCAKQVLWFWLAIDPLSKIIPVLHLGSRTQTSAHTVIHSLRQILAPGCLPLFTSDGLNLYFYALTAHFGHWLQMTRRGRKILRWQVAKGLIYGLTPVGSSGMVASVLSFCASSPLAASSARAAGSREVASWWRNATGNGHQPWQLAEPPDDGRRRKCCAIPYRRCPASAWEHKRSEKTP